MGEFIAFKKLLSIIHAENQQNENQKCQNSQILHRWL